MLLNGFTSNCLTSAKYKFSDCVQESKYCIKQNVVISKKWVNKTHTHLEWEEQDQKKKRINIRTKNKRHKLNKKFSERVEKVVGKKIAYNYI